MHTKVLVPKLRMTKWLVLLSFMILILFAVSPVQAAVNVVPINGDVFVGEQNLDITNAVGTGPSTIVWFNPGDNPSTAIPSQTVTVTNPASYYIDPAIFGLYEGNWYNWTGAPPAGHRVFVVNNPHLAVSVYDPVGVVPSGFNRYLGTKLNFRLDTNLISLVTQRSATNGFIDLFVRDSTGVTYNSLYTTSSIPNPKPLGNLLVGITPFYWSDQSITDLFWKTSAREPVTNNIRYSAGTYTIWGQTNSSATNGLYIVSNQNLVNLIQETLSATTIPSVSRSNPFTVNITGRPNTQYTIWILNNPCHPMSGASCDQPPWITQGQRNVIFDPQSPAIANLTVVPTQCIADAQVWQTIPTGGVNVPNYPYQYYANVTTDSNGLASVGFTTTTDTAPLTYTVHVQGIKLDGDPIYADTPITVTKGAVTILAPSSAILGEHILINGTNTDSFFTYLYITGPCQPQCGANLTNPGVPLINKDKTTFTEVRINNTDRSWVYNLSQNGWDTSVLKIQPGVYTIYASSTPKDACNLGPCDAYSTAVVTINPPTINATINPSVLIRQSCPACGGNSVIITGTTTGNPTHKIGYWIFGEQQKVGDVHYVHGYIDDCCGAFTFDIASKVNMGALPVGKYYVVLQHPMYNHVFDVLIEGDFQDNIDYISPQHPQTPPYTIIGEQNKLYVISSDPIRWSKVFPIEGADAKRELDALHALTDALDRPTIDDKYIVLNFTVKDENAPTADFMGTPTSGGSPLTVSFTDQSQGNPTSWLWDFGDGSTSTLQSPQHTYLNEGDFTVRLTASKVVNGITVSDSITKEHYIHVGPVSLQANFVADQTVGLAPFTVDFTDLTSGSPTQWTWNFGDGGFAIDQNPTHTYTGAGTYTVTLTARNSDQTSTLAKPNYITVTTTPTQPPVDPSKIILNPGWNFVSTPKVLAAGSNTGAIFSNVNMGGRSAWIWDGSASPPQWIPVISTTPIQPLWGIWIYSVSNTVVNLNFDTTNPLYIPPPRNLPAGWSSIGFTGSTQQTARNTYLSVQPNWTTSMGFNAVTQNYEATIFNGDPTELTVLYPTKGYWLYMRTPGNLAAIGA